MSIEIEYDAGEEYPSASSLVKAMGEATRRAKCPLRIVGGEMTLDTAPRCITIVNTDDCDWETYGGTIAGLFLG